MTSPVAAARSRVDEVRERLQLVEDEIAALNERYKDQKFPEELRSDWNALNSQRDELAELVKRESRVYLLRSVEAGNTEPGVPRDIGGAAVAGRFADPWTQRSGPLTDRAHAAVDALHDRGSLGDDSAVLARRLVSGDQPQTDLVRSWVLAASNPHYESGFMKLVRNPTTGHRAFTAAETEAYERAMALSPDTAGGSLTVPFTLDPSIALSSAGSVDPFRAVCRRVTIAGTDTWKGVSSAGVVANWYPEGGETSDDSPTMTSPEIPTHRASAWVPFSMEIDEDFTGLRNELAQLFVDAKQQLEASAFTTGTGTGQPQGLVGALAAGQTVNTGGTAAYTADDAYNLVEAVPPRFRADMRVLAPLPVITSTRRFTTDVEPEIVPASFDSWLGRPLHETSTLDDTITTGNTIAVAGDFSQAVIVDRIGMTVELNPMVMGANGRPTGQRGLFAFWRVGFDVLVPNALRKLVVT